MFIRSFFRSFLDSEEYGLAKTFSEVLEMQLHRSFDVLYGYIGLIAVFTIEAAVFIVFLTVFNRLLKKMILDHSGSVINYVPEERDEDASEQTTESLLKLLKFSTVIGIVSAVVTACESFLCIVFPMIWIPELLLKAVWVISYTVLILRVKSSVKQKYYL